MPKRDACLAKVIADRDNDAPRLAYANWLAKHGEPDRADFIRTQIELAGMRPWDEGHDDLKAREQQLLEKHHEEWLAPVGPMSHKMFEPQRDDLEKFAVFRRGFVDTAFVDAERFLEAPDAVFDAAPVSGLVFLLGGLSPEFLDCEGLGRATRLHIISWRSRTSMRVRGTELAPNDFEALAECRHLEQLRELDLSSQPRGAKSVAALIASEKLPNLETLKLEMCDLGRAAFVAIGLGMALPNLKHLDLSYNEAHLASWHGRAWTRQLRQLDLAACKFDIDELAAFLEQGDWPDLEVLSLWTLLGGDSRGRLPKALQAMPRLVSLNLAWRQFEEPLRSLTEAGPFPALEHLDVSGMYASGPVELLTTDAFPHLRELVLANNRRTEGLSALRDTSLAQSLRRLDISGCDLSAEEIIAFARTVRMPRLEALTIGDGKWDEKALQALGEARGLPRLRTLELRLSGLKSLEVLATAPLVRQLAHLHLERMSINKKCVDVLLAGPSFQGLTSLQLQVRGDNKQRLHDHFGERVVGW